MPHMRVVLPMPTSAEIMHKPGRVGIIRPTPPASFAPSSLFGRWIAIVVKLQLGHSGRSVRCSMRDGAFRAIARSTPQKGLTALLDCHENFERGARDFQEGS